MTRRVLRLAVLGTTVTVDLGGDASLAALADPWARCRASAPAAGAVGGHVRAQIGPPRADGPGAELVSAPTPAALAERLTVAVTLAGIDATRGDQLLLHAGAVAAEDGSVVAFVGASGAGKTTLVRVLARRLGYVTDETVGVRPDLAVQPYPKPLSLVVVPGEPKAQVGADELGLRALPDAPLRLRALVLLARDPDHDGPPELARPSLAEAVPELVPQVSHLVTGDRPLLRLQRLLEACGGLVRVTYRDAEDLVDVVPALARRTPPAARPATATSRQDSLRSRPVPRVRPGPGRVGRADVVDAVAVDDAVLVLLGGRVEVLRGIAPALWTATERPAGPAELTAAVVGEHGAPTTGDATDLVERAVAELVAAGVLVRTA